MDAVRTLLRDMPAPPVIRTLLVADIVESTQLFERDTVGTTAHWLAIFDQIQQEILPACRGNLVRSLGDGVLLEFADARAAVAAAFAIHHACHRVNLARSAERPVLLRIGIETGDVLLSHGDVWGHNVTLATRLCSLAGPGEIIVSARTREQLTPELDADIEDLGECYLKHVREPVRAYRVGPPGPGPVLETFAGSEELRPTIAVVPFTCRDRVPEYELVGDVLAEELIQELSGSPEVDVISRLSTLHFRDRPGGIAEAFAHLQSNYVVSGSFGISGDEIRLSSELAEAKSGRVVWSGTVREKVRNIVQTKNGISTGLAAEVRKAIIIREVQRARSQRLPNLQSYTLLLAAVGLLHRMSLRDFEDARHLLEAVIDRARRQALPHAWMAQWFVLRVQQGWSADPARDARQALESSRRALDADPDCSLALAVDGLVHTHFLKRLDVARRQYQLAVEQNPSDSLAWLLKGTLHAFMGEGREAVANTKRALLLSPLDPHRYYYDSLAGTACLAAGDYEGALRHAHRSLRANCSHTSTLRVATIAAWRLGSHDDARLMARKLLRLEPGLTIRGYLARTPAAPFATGKDWADALRQAGIPA